MAKRACTGQKQERGVVTTVWNSAFESDQTEINEDSLFSFLPTEVIYDIFLWLGESPYHVLSEIIRMEIYRTCKVFNNVYCMFRRDFEAGRTEAGLPIGEVFQKLRWLALKGEPIIDYLVLRDWAYLDVDCFNVRGKLEDDRLWDEFTIAPTLIDQGVHTLVYRRRVFDDFNQVTWGAGYFDRQCPLKEVYRVVSYDPVCKNAALCCEHHGCVQKDSTVEHCECTFPCPICGNAVFGGDCACCFNSDQLTHNVHELENTPYSQYCDPQGVRTVFEQLCEPGRSLI